MVPLITPEAFSDYLRIYTRLSTLMDDIQAYELCCSIPRDVLDAVGESGSDAGSGCYQRYLDRWLTEYMRSDRSSEPALPAALPPTMCE